jgi:tRNA-binding EMAP/Myf-like protein
MAFALRAVHSIAASAPLRAAASRRVSARAPSAARVATRAMADEAAEPPPVHELVDVRVGKVLKCYKHEEADKLYVEEVDVGEEEPRQICSGLVPYMNAEVRRPERTERTFARGRGERTRADPSLTRSTRSVGDRIDSIRSPPSLGIEPTKPDAEPSDGSARVSSTNERTSERATNERLPLLLDETNSNQLEPTRTNPLPLPTYSQDIEGQLVVVLANLKARNMAGVSSHGMLLCASDASHEKVELLVCPEGAVPGERIKFGDFDAEQLDPHTENQMKKKKTWEKVAPDLRTTDACGAAYKDLPMVTSAGAVACASIAGGTIG